MHRIVNGYQLLAVLIHWILTMFAMVAMFASLTVDTTETVTPPESYAIHSSGF
jgi:cytochrome b561